MSFLPLAVFSFFGFAIAAAGCGDSDDVCACPTVLMPLRVAAPCDVHPTLQASGTCTVSGDGVDLTAPGLCTVVLTHDDDTTDTATFTVTNVAIACGSDPTGCGHSLDVTGPDGIGPQLDVGPQRCTSEVDAGDGG